MLKGSAQLLRSLLGFSCFFFSLGASFAYMTHSYNQYLVESGQLDLVQLREALASDSAQARKLHQAIINVSEVPSELKIVAGGGAYSLGGVNWIVVGEELISQLSADQLLFLFAHESVHLGQNHHESRFNIISGIEPIFNPKDYDRIARANQYLLFPQFWSEEFTADELGIEWAVAAGADPIKALSLFTLIDSDIYHPTSNRRLRNAAEHVKNKLLK